MTKQLWTRGMVHDKANAAMSRFTLASIMALTLGACAVGPDYVRPKPPTSDRYTREPVPTTFVADGQRQALIFDGNLPAEWWKLFRSAQLDAIVRQSLDGNPTIQAAQENLRQSQDELRAGSGVYFPQVGAEAGAVRQRTAPSIDGISSPGSIFNVISLSGSVSYAFDFFGGERRSVENLAAQADYQNYSRAATFLSLTANLVETVIAHAAYSAQVRTSEQLIGLERQQLTATEAQVKAGTASFTSVIAIRSLIAANQSQLAPLRQKLDQAEHLIASLEGVLPSQVFLPDIELDDLSLPNEVPLRVPADLVRQRPDILAAEAQVHAASANIGVATSLMFPSISLDASYGRGGSSINAMSMGSGTFWSIGPSISMPLFQGGRLWYGRKAAIDSFHQAQELYRQTVVSACEQVADALKALQHDAEGLEAQAEAQRLAVDALALIRINFNAGLSAKLDVLAVDVQRHQIAIGYLQAVAQRHQDTVALFAALGGGWWSAPSQHAAGAVP